MDITQIKELLQNPKVKELVEAEIIKAVESKQAEIDQMKAALVESRKKAEKDLFIHKKMLVAKATMYENKLKALSEAKLAEATKKLSKDVYEFINESINNLSKTVENDVKSTSSASKLTEAFSNAVRLMAPFMNINELAEGNNTVVENYKAKVNRLMVENKELRSKVLSDDVNTLVVKECAGYPLEKQTVIVNTLKQLAPKTLTEAKQQIDTIKQKLKEKTQEAVSNPSTVVTENTKVNAAKERLLRLAEQTKRAEKAVEGSKNKDMTAPEDIF